MKRTHSLAGALALAFPGAVLAQAPATSQQVGLGCAPTAVIPDSNLTPPVLGGTATYSIFHSFNPSPAIVFASPGPPVSVFLGAPWVLPLCVAFVDPATAFPFASPAVTPGSFSIPVPNDPALAGADVTFQAVILVSPLPFGQGPILTNGVHAVPGV